MNPHNPLSLSYIPAGFVSFQVSTVLFDLRNVPDSQVAPSGGSSLAWVPGSSDEKMDPNQALTLVQVSSRAHRFFSSSSPITCESRIDVCETGLHNAISIRTNPQWSDLWLVWQLCSKAQAYCRFGVPGTLWSG